MTKKYVPRCQDLLLDPAKQTRSRHTFRELHSDIVFSSILIHYKYKLAMQCIYNQYLVQSSQHINSALKQQNLLMTSKKEDLNKYSTPWASKNQNKLRYLHRAAYCLERHNSVLLPYSHIILHCSYRQGISDRIENSWVSNFQHII